MLPIMISDGLLEQRDAWRYVLELSDLTLIDERKKSLANDKRFGPPSQGGPHGRLCPDRGVGGADLSLLARLRSHRPLNG